MFKFETHSGHSTTLLYMASRIRSVARHGPRTGVRLSEVACMIIRVPHQLARQRQALIPLKEPDTPNVNG